MKIFFRVLLTIFAVFYSQVAISDEMFFEKGKLHYRTESKELILLPDTILKKTLQKNPDLFLAPKKFKKSNSLLILARYASKPQGLGRCGAGTEDYLLLVKIMPPLIKLRDKLFIQSCEKNFNLDTPDPYDPNSLFEAINLDEDNQSLHFTINRYINGESVSEPMGYIISDNKFVPM